MQSWCVRIRNEIRELPWCPTTVVLKVESRDPKLVSDQQPKGSAKEFAIGWHH